MLRQRPTDLDTSLGGEVQDFAWTEAQQFGRAREGQLASREETESIRLGPLVKDLSKGRGFVHALLPGSKICKRKQVVWDPQSHRFLHDMSSNR
jgi:hypothetical protein